MGQVAQGVDAHAHQLLGGFAANTPKVGERVDLPEFRWHIRIAPAGLPRRRDLGFVIKREFRQEWILADTHGGDDASRREDFILDGGGDGVIAAKHADLCRHRCGRHSILASRLNRVITEKLRLGWSPEMVGHTVRCAPHTIYHWIYQIKIDFQLTQIFDPR